MMTKDNSPDLVVVTEANIRVKGVSRHPHVDLQAAVTKNILVVPVDLVGHLGLIKDQEIRAFI